MSIIQKGVYPTMITPYNDGKIDYKNVEKLVEWYIKNGCTGIFAVCQSSEMVYLSLQERVELSKRIVEQVGGRINVVSSGHCGNSIEEQEAEVEAIAETGADAVVLVSNRFDLHDEGDDVWLKNAEELLKKTDESISFGIYECPRPYKRLLTPRILDWCLETGRFKFIKDTCCNPDILSERLTRLNGSDLLLFNANAQTLLYSLERGGAGYSGVMANFHPDLYVWLCNNFKKDEKKAIKISDLLSIMAWTENPVYPCTAKYYLSEFEGFNIETYARVVDQRTLTSYQKYAMEELYRLTEETRKLIKP
jgi:4-hydroxy-tetrahydrodipicolinate synthase